MRPAAGPAFDNPVFKISGTAARLDSKELPHCDRSNADCTKFRLASPLPCQTSMPDQTELRQSDLARRIIGCFYAVYNELGFGFSEAVFRRAMVIALLEAGLKVEDEVRMQVHFHGAIIGTFYADIIVEGAVLMEIKALPEIDDRSVAQLLNYLKVAGGGVGLLLNFGRRPEFSRRIVDNVEKIGV